MISQTLSLKKDLPRVRQAFNNKEFGAFHGMSHCLYDYGDGHHCAIGSILDRPMLNYLRDSGRNMLGFSCLMDEDCLQVKDDFDRKAFQFMQCLHDQWTHGSVVCLSEIQDATEIGFIDISPAEPIDADLFDRYLTWLEAKVA